MEYLNKLNCFFWRIWVLCFEYSSSTKLLCVGKENVPVLYGPGPHVIHDRNFGPVTEADLVDVNSQHINHGNFHHHPRVLSFTHCSNFYQQFALFFCCQVTSHIFSINPVFFNFVDFVHMTTLYIAHGNYHILQIPRGKVAKIWKGSIPELLEARDTPYLFEDQTFRVDPYSDTETFVSSTEKMPLFMVPSND